MMEDQSLYTFKTLSERARFLFGKETLSDVQLAMPGRLFNGHKFILSLASPFFHEYFYNRSQHDQEKGNVMVFPITDTDPTTFEALLRPMYGEEIDFESFGIRNVRLLYSAAKRYQVISVEVQCQEYLVDSYVQPKIACQTFEMALKSGDMHNIEEACKLTFSEHTIKVFESEFFTQSTLATVETIVKMDTLNIDSEMDVIEAIIKWGEAKLRKTRNVKSSLRECIQPLLIHVRFLALENEAFEDFTNKYVDVLLSNEVSAIMRKLCMGQGQDREIPNGLCSIKSPRQKPILDEGYQFGNTSTTCQSDDLNDTLSHITDAAKENQNQLINDSYVNDTTDKSFLSENKSFDSESLKSFTVIKTLDDTFPSENLGEVEKNLLHLTATCDNRIKGSFPKPSAPQDFGNISYKEKVETWKQFSANSSDNLSAMTNNKLDHIAKMKTQNELLVDSFQRLNSSKPELTSNHMQGVISRLSNPSRDNAESIRNSNEFLSQQKVYGSETGKMENIKSFTSPKNVNMDDSDDDSGDGETEDTELPDHCRAISIPISNAQLPKGIHTRDISSVINLTINEGRITLIGLIFELNYPQQTFCGTVVVNLKGRNLTVDQMEQVKVAEICESFEFVFEKPVILQAPTSISIKATIDNLQLQYSKVCQMSQFDGADEKNKYTVAVNSNQNSKGLIPCLISKILYLE